MCTEKNRRRRHKITNNDKIVLMGYFNAKVEICQNDEYSDNITAFELGERNAR